MSPRADLRRLGLPGRRAPGPGPLRRPAAGRDAADPAGWCTGACCRRHPLYSWPGLAQWGLLLRHAAKHCRMQRVPPVAAGLCQRQLEPHGSQVPGAPQVLVHGALPLLHGRPPAGLCARAQPIAGHACSPVCIALSACASGVQRSAAGTLPQSEWPCASRCARRCCMLGLLQPWHQLQLVQSTQAPPALAACWWGVGAGCPPHACTAVCTAFGACSGPLVLGPACRQRLAALRNGAVVVAPVTYRHARLLLPYELPLQAFC